MGGRHKFARLVISLVGIVGASGSVATPAEAPDAWRARVSAKLLSIYDSAAGASAAGARNPAVAVSSESAAGPARFNDNGWVQADVHYDCSRGPPTKALAAAGLSINSSVRLASFCVVEGWIAPQSVSEIATVAGVTRVKIPAYVVHPRLRAPASMALAGSAGTIDGNGVTIMHADQFVSRTGANGAGAKVGVQSGGISNLRTVQSRGELPAVQVVNPSGGSGAYAGDEGTVLLEEVHAVASGAGLAYCGPNTFVEYTSCLSQLVTAGATILVDDLIFPGQDLLSADSSGVQAVEQLLTQNPSVALFTAAGNYNGSYWEGNYSPIALSSLGLPPLTCPSNGTTQTDYYVAEFYSSPSQLLTVKQSGSVPVAFAWADPPNHNTSKFDVYWVDSADSTKSGCFSAKAATDNQVMKYLGFTTGSYTVYIATPDATPAGKFLKLWIGGDGLTSLSNPTRGSVVAPQAFASGAVTVGAVNGSDGIGNGIEPFSSLGPVTLSFPQLTRIQAPILVAPDGINVDAVGTDFAGYLFPDGNFYGTSASAPNAAAVAALIRGAFPTLTASELISGLKTGAAQLGSATPDGTFGFGRIDALGALGTFPTPTITSLPPNAALTAGTSSSPYSFTVSGTGALHFSVASSNPSSIPASIVAAGSPGVTIVPSDCGVTTLSCSLSVIPANGPGGAVNLTVTAADGANRSASTVMSIAVTGSQPAPATSTPSSGGSGGGGGLLGWWVIGSLGLIAGFNVWRRGMFRLQ